MTRRKYFLYFFHLVMALDGVLYFLLFSAFAFLHITISNRLLALMCLNSLERNVADLSRFRSLSQCFLIST